MNKKTLGQVSTPQAIVCDILDVAGYNGIGILKKHVMDNSCGNGAFLTEIAKRYLEAYRKNQGTLDGVENELSIYIHGIDIDKNVGDACRAQLDTLAKQYGLSDVAWDISQENTLRCNRFDGKMNFVIGNPPYVRIHHLKDQSEDIKQCAFSKNGMTDLYIAFFEVGFRMLTEKGKLAYITPNSFYTSTAGETLRDYIRKTQSLFCVMELGHYQPFDVSVYTTITCFEKSARFEAVDVYRYHPQIGRPDYQCAVRMDTLFIDQKMILPYHHNSLEFEKIYTLDVKDSPIIVKNGYATLADSVFIQPEFPFTSHQIDVIKASTGQWKKCFYPYDRNGNTIPLDSLSEKALLDYLNQNKTRLMNRTSDKNAAWYGFGRSQAISDTYQEKIAINTMILDIDSIRMESVAAGQGVYSGLYILTKHSYQEVEAIIKTESFLHYVRCLNKCKSGGYYTFSSVDLRKFLTYYLENRKGEAKIDQQ